MALTSFAFEAALSARKVSVGLRFEAAALLTGALAVAFAALPELTD